MQHSISKAFGYLGTKNYMHLLHLIAQEEINNLEVEYELISNCELPTHGRADVMGIEQ